MQIFRYSAPIVWISVHCPTRSAKTIFPGQIYSKRRNETILKSLKNLCTVGCISQPLAGKSWSQTTMHIWNIWLEECVCAMLISILRCVFKVSGCMEVPAPGLLHIKATCLCFSFLQACDTCSSHTGTCAQCCLRMETSWVHMILLSVKD